MTLERTNSQAPKSEKMLANFWNSAIFKVAVYSNDL
jgi:hypothetical protein